MVQPKPKRRSLLKRWRLKSSRGDGSGVCPLKNKIFATKLYFVKKTDREERRLKGTKRRRPVNATKLGPKLCGIKLM